jgi:bacteriocin-like protein
MSKEEIRKQPFVNQQAETTPNANDQSLSDDELKAITGGAHSPVPLDSDGCIISN